MGILTILTFFPLLGVLALLLLKPITRRETDVTVKWIAIGTSALTFILSLVLLAMYDTSASGLQFVEKVNWIPSWGISYQMV